MISAGDAVPRINQFTKKEHASMNYEQLLKQYESIKARGRKLDMSRGKPSPEQLGTMSRLLTAVIRND